MAQVVPATAAEVVEEWVEKVCSERKSAFIWAGKEKLARKRLSQMVRRVGRVGVRALVV